MNRTKVAIVLPYFGSGGAEHMVAHYCSHLNLEKLNVQVFCIFGQFQNNNLEKEIIEHGIKIRYVGKKIGFSIKAMRKLSKMLSDFLPDVVHSHLYGIIYVFPWLVIHKNVRAFHTMHTIPERENRRLIRKWISKFLFCSSRVTPIAISDTNQRLIAEFYKISRNNIPVVYNPVITKRFFHRDKMGDSCIFVTVGRLLALKNHKLMIGAFSTFCLRSVNAPELWIVGTGEMEEELKDYTELLKITKQVRFWGYRSDVEEILSRADVFVLSSEFEGLPLCLLEAMAAGLPVISTDVGGVSDIITDNGILVQPGNKEQLARAMKILMDDVELRKKLSEASLLNVKAYDVEKTAYSYEKLYEMCGKRR